MPRPDESEVSVFERRRQVAAASIRCMSHRQVHECNQRPTEGLSGTPWRDRQRGWRGRTARMRQHSLFFS